jgi:hypothetical protein
VVPTIPSIVQKAQDVLREGDAAAAKRAAELLEQDPFLAARALRAAVSGKAQGPSSKKATLGDVVTKLGPRAVKALLVDATASGGMGLGLLAGARVLAEPVETPWRSLNARLDAPANLHITVFQELDPVEDGMGSSNP